MDTGPRPRMENNHVTISIWTPPKRDGDVRAPDWPTGLMRQHTSDPGIKWPQFFDGARERHSAPQASVLDLDRLSNQIRGWMKTFGLSVPAAKRGHFGAEIQRLLAGYSTLKHVLLPLLEAWITVRGDTAELGRQRLMSITGMGARSPRRPSPRPSKTPKTSGNPDPSPSGQG